MSFVFLLKDNSARSQPEDKKMPCGKGKGTCPADVKTRLAEYSETTQQLVRVRGWIGSFDDVGSTKKCSMNFWELDVPLLEKNTFFGIIDLIKFIFNLIFYVKILQHLKFY